jgi:hypothetical protein
MEPKPKKKMPVASKNDDEDDDVKIPALPSTASAAASAAAAAAGDTADEAEPSTKPYVYRDFAQDDTDYGGDHDISTVVQDGRGLTNQKLPAKLSAMLSDPGK